MDNRQERQMLRDISDIAKSLAYIAYVLKEEHDEKRREETSGETRKEEESRV